MTVMEYDGCSLSFDIVFFTPLISGTMGSFQITLQNLEVSKRQIQ